MLLLEGYKGLIKNLSKSKRYKQMEKNTVGLGFACLKATLSFYFPSGETIDLLDIIVPSPHRP